MVQCVGLKVSNGEFTNRETGEVIAYDNVVLYCLQANVKDVVGCFPIEVKIKRENFNNITGLTVADASTFVNKELKLDYELCGKYPQLSSITILKK